MYTLYLSQIKTYILQQIIAWMAGDAVHDTGIVDSGGFGISGYKDWYDAKYGNIRVQDLAKLHAIHEPQGKISAATVTPVEANDSPYLRKMMPNGSGNLLGDGAYRRIKIATRCETADADPSYTQVDANHL